MIRLGFAMLGHVGSKEGGGMKSVSSVYNPAQWLYQVCNEFNNNHGNKKRFVGLKVIS